VELIEEAEINLTMIDVQENRSIWEKDFNNDTMYNILVDLP